MNACRPRITELDYLKSILIVLMIVFHLSAIGSMYPTAKQFVYTFHMPGFLIISGFLLNFRKEWKAMGHAMLWIFIPYAIMEAGYVYAASWLPVSDHVDRLTPVSLLPHIFVKPLGPYWYLHTLIVCSMTTYVVLRAIRFQAAVQLSVLALCFWGISRLGIVSWSNALYFWIGVCISRSRMNFVEVFRPTWLSLVFVASLVVFIPGSMSKETLGGVMIVYFMLSFLLRIYRYVPHRGKTVLHFIGRNTLVLLLFSPIFTLLSKCFLPILEYEPTGILFTAMALALTLGGCFLMAYISDKLYLSRLFFGTDRVIR